MSLPVADAHAFLRPSAAARWVLCPGSALMESRYPEAGDKAAAAEGVAVHWCMQQLFEGWSSHALLQDGKTEAGHPLTREMVEGAQLIYDDVRATLHAPHLIHVEQPVRIPRVHPSACWGTPDVRASVPDVFAGTVTLYLWDLKFGHGQVEVFENWQLIAYAAGWLDDFRHIPEDRITFVFRIVQPRSYHADGPVREWRVRADALQALVFRLSMAADEAMQPEPECKPQPAACENCTARHACDALQRAAYRGMDLARQAQAGELSPAALGLELRYLSDASKLMAARLTGLQAQAEMLLRQGASVPHWKLEAGSSRAQWQKPTAEVLMLGQMLGLNLAKEAEAITPTQARELAKRQGVDGAIFSAYSARLSGAVRLSVDDGSDARKVFTSI